MSDHTYPPPIQLNWETYLAERGRASDIDGSLADLDGQIAKVQAELESALDALKTEHAEFGRARTTHQTNADLLHDIVATWCAKTGVPLPPEPVEPEPAPAPERNLDDASIWERAVCVCGGSIIRDRLNGGPWGHFDTGHTECKPELGERSPVAQPRCDDCESSGYNCPAHRTPLVTGEAADTVLDSLPEHDDDAEEATSGE
jgi:hypothetical protein